MTKESPEKSGIQTIRLPWMGFEVSAAEGFTRREGGRNLSSSLVVGPPDLPQLNGASMFWESRLKVYRARYHIHTASEIWELFANLDNNMVRVEFNAAKGQHYLRTSPVGIPFDFRLAISDALRCLRSALDYLVAAMARAKGISDEHIIFPFNKERSQIEGMFEPVTEGKKRPKRGKPFYDLSQTYPDLKDMILGRIQPFSAEYGASPLGDFLWRLITMDNIDKHRLLSPTIKFSHVKSGSIGGIGLENVGLIGWGPDQSPITVVGAPDEAQPEADATMDVIFPEKTLLPGKPVLSAFVQGSNFVSEVIGFFEDAFDTGNRPG